MPVHYCYGNPCYLCHPTTEGNLPLVEELLSERLIPTTGISVVLAELLEDIFRYGIKEDAYWWREESNQLSLSKIELERTHVSDTSLEAKLLDKLIDYMKNSDEVRRERP